MMPRWDVLGIGAVAVDDLLYLDGYPAPDSMMRVCEELRQGGGLAGTALVAAARLGARAAYIGVLGDDELSRFTLAEFAAEGVDCTPVRFMAAARPYHSVILVNRLTGERTILSSNAGVVRPRPAEISPALIADCRVLFVDGTVGPAALRAAELAHEWGAPVVADLERITAGVPELMARVDHLIVGTAFAAKITGADRPAEMARRLAQPGQAACIVTAGDAGCWYVAGGRGEVRRHPACRVQTVDTTGCGDVFHGAYAAALARGYDVAAAVSVATVAAGLKVTQPGGRRGIPDWATVERYLHENPFDRDAI